MFDWFSSIYAENPHMLSVKRSATTTSPSLQNPALPCVFAHLLCEHNAATISGTSFRICHEANVCLKVWKQVPCGSPALTTAFRQAPSQTLTLGLLVRSFAKTNSDRRMPSLSLLSARDRRLRITSLASAFSTVRNLFTVLSTSNINHNIPVIFLWLSFWNV
jgi:hypothetical protein